MQDITRSRQYTLLRGIDMLATLNNASVAEIAAHAQILEPKRSNLVIEKGRTVDGLYCVASGRLKIYLLSCGGNERTLRVLQEGESFGEAIMFNRIPSPVYVEAMTSCELLFIPRNAVIEATLSQPEFTFSMMRSLSRLLQELIRDLEDCCTRNARQRVAHYLVTRAANSHLPYQEVELPASKKVIASTLNLTAETFSRELHDFERLGLLTVSRRTLHLHDADGLDKIANSEEQSDA